jgi:hypothetical protein
MLFSLPPPMDSASASAILSELRWGSRAAIHWTVPAGYLVSDKLPDPTLYFNGGPARSLTEIEERLVWKALFDSGEMLYSL